MGYINLFVGSKASLSIKNNQLVLSNEANQQSYPACDINSVLIENMQSTISIYTLNFLVEHNCLIYICNNQHLPVAYVLGYNSFYKNLQVYTTQTQAKKPLLKNIWSAIVNCKIKNQATVLDLNNIQHTLYQVCQTIKSGDTANAEAVAAAQYFKLLFGKTFTRDTNCLINSALNYGYAIVRGCIARSVVVHGLQPFIGIHHCNKLNAFNLVDDLIEPFRPLVDLFVYSNYFNITSDLTPQIKCQLQGLLNLDVSICGQKHTLSNAIDKFVTSFIRAITNEQNNLDYPTICGLGMHEYE